MSIVVSNIPFLVNSKKHLENILSKLESIPNTNNKVETIQGIPETLDPKEEALSYSNESASSFVKDLIHSILSGEYVYSSSTNEIEEIVSVFDSIKKLLLEKSISEDDIELNKIPLNKIQLFFSNIKENLFFNIKGEKRFHFIDEVSKIFNNSEIDEIVKEFHSQSSDLQSSEYSITNIISLLKVNILLAEIDSALECTDKSLRTLIKVYHSFIEREGENIPFLKNTLVTICKEKCEFLMYKIMKRLKIDIVFDEEFVLNDKQLKVKKIEKDFIFFKDFYKLTKQNYDLEKNGDIEINEIFVSRHKNNGLNLFSDYHRFSKLLYKDKKNFKNNTSEIIALKNELEEKISNLKNRNDIDKNILVFNNIAYSNIQFLILKNKLKILKNEIISSINNKEAEINVLVRLKDQLILNYKNINSFIEKNNIEEHKINDYYHHLLFAEIIIKFSSYCLNLIHKEKYIFNIVEDLLREIGYELRTDNHLVSNRNDEFTNMLENNIAISQAKNYFPIYMPFEECFIEIPSNEEFSDISIKKIFLDSSYILPVNYHIQLQKVNEIKLEFYFINLLYNRVKSVEIMMQQYKLDIETTIKEKSEFFISKAESSISEKNKTLTKEIEEKTRNASISGVQTLGTFSSVIAIVLVFVNIIPKEDDIIIRIIFMLAFSLSISIFLLGINHIVNNKSGETSFKNSFLKLLFPNKIYVYLTLLGLFIIIFFILHIIFKDKFYF